MVLCLGLIMPKASRFLLQKLTVAQLIKKKFFDVYTIRMCRYWVHDSLEMQNSFVSLQPTTFVTSYHFICVFIHIGENYVKLKFFIFYTVPT